MILFLLFCEKLIRVIFAMLVIAIKHLKVQLNNLNMIIRISVICFEILFQTRNINKQMTGALYY